MNTPRSNTATQDRRPRADLGKRSHAMKARTLARKAARRAKLAPVRMEQR